mmetsp:Transcript_8457/g.21838  ORF Transcript_8457/g.21838 Transcript_8457/m.21838 type:complete len:309 (+) Transcript_8457:138-1064(+)
MLARPSFSIRIVRVIARVLVASGHLPVQLLPLHGGSHCGTSARCGSACACGDAGRRQPLRPRFLSAVRVAREQLVALRAAAAVGSASPAAARWPGQAACAQGARRGWRASVALTAAAFVIIAGVRTPRRPTLIRAHRARSLPHAAHAARARRSLLVVVAVFVILAVAGTACARAPCTSHAGNACWRAAMPAIIARASVSARPARGAAIPVVRSRGCASVWAIIAAPCAELAVIVHTQVSAAPVKCRGGGAAAVGVVVCLGAAAAARCASLHGARDVRGVGTHARPRRESGDARAHGRGRQRSAGVCRG